MKIMVGQSIADHFLHEPVAKNYVGEERAKNFEDFKVVTAIDFKTVAYMLQVITFTFKDEAGEYGEGVLPEEIEAMFDDDMTYTVKATGLDYETQSWVVCLVHSY